MTTVDLSSITPILERPDGFRWMEMSVRTTVDPDTLGGFAISGTYGTSPYCREVRDRLRAAILNSGFEWPLGRITVHASFFPVTNLEPRLVDQNDLAVAVAVLMATGQIEGREAHGRWVVGELSLDGKVRSPESNRELSELLNIEILEIEYLADLQ